MNDLPRYNLLIEVLEKTSLSKFKIVSPSSIITSFNDWQEAKALDPIDFIELGIKTDAILLALKASLYMYITE
ncbi:MAG: hypothetical protein K2K81_08265 [Muribaculaceae bacterium]|nr:hypothetical protein [Muribaculaceae bacterium]